jgi:hypothetical protein
VSFSLRGVPAGGRKQLEEPAGLWPKRYKAMTMAELVAELTRLASEPPQHDYDMRRRFILQELDLRTSRHVD